MAFSTLFVLFSSYSTELHFLNLMSFVILVEVILALFKSLNSFAFSTLRLRIPEDPGGITE